MDTVKIGKDRDPFTPQVEYIALIESMRCTPDIETGEFELLAKEDVGHLRLCPVATLPREGCGSERRCQCAFVT